MKPRRRSNSRIGGIVLLALLLTLVLMSIALLGAVDLWSTERRREKEEDLLFVGEQYQRAIERYYHMVSGTGKALPANIEDLLEDRRFPVPMHHLRRAYADPMTGEQFTLLRLGDRIYGVTSSSTQATFKRAGFSPKNRSFEGTENYSQWKFVFVPPKPAMLGRGIPPSSQRSDLNGVKQ